MANHAQQKTGEKSSLLIRVAREEGQKTQLTAAEMRKRRILRSTLLRAGIQAAFFLTMPGMFVAGFSGVKNLFAWMGEGEVLRFNSFTKTLIGLVLPTILFGRFFCGYVCAFGSFGDFVHWLSSFIQRKVFHRKKIFQFPGKWVSRLQKLKYLNLAAIVILCWMGVYGSFTGSSPWDVFSRLAALKAVPEGYIWGILSFLVIVAGMAMQERFFCQFLCPLGALFSVLPVLPWGMLRRDSGHCVPSCNVCANQCPVRLKLEEDGIRNGECIACEKCMAACPRGNIGHAEKKWISREWMPVLAKAVLFFVMGACLGFCRFF